MRPLFSALLCAALVASPVLSQDRPAPNAELTELTMMVGASDTDDRLKGAVALCYALWGDYDAQQPFMEEMGWSHAFWGGMHEYGKDGTYVYMSTDFFCDVSSGRRTQAQARDILETVLSLDTSVTWELSETSMGCPRWTSSAGGIVVSSDGQDPVCTPTEGSAIRFWMAGGE